MTHCSAPVLKMAFVFLFPPPAESQLAVCRCPLPTPPTQPGAPGEPRTLSPGLAPPRGRVPCTGRCRESGRAAGTALSPFPRPRPAARPPPASGCQGRGHRPGPPPAGARKLLPGGANVCIPRAAQGACGLLRGAQDGGGCSPKAPAGSPRRVSPRWRRLPPLRRAGAPSGGGAKGF